MHRCRGSGRFTDRGCATGTSTLVTFVGLSFTWPTSRTIITDTIYCLLDQCRILRRNCLKSSFPSQRTLVTPRQRDVNDREGVPSSTTYYHCFGGWSDALVAAGLEPDPRGSHVADEDLLEALEDLADELGVPPTAIVTVRNFYS